MSGLVLEGGGLRGIFTAGVLDFFMEKNIRFDSVIGVSAGSCHACSYVSNQPGRAFATSTDYLKDKHYCSFYSLITTGDMFGVKFVYDDIPNRLNPIDNAAFMKSGISFQAVITNCKTGKAEYPYVRDLKKDIVYVRASSSLPALSRMVEINGGLYLDGGISDSIPLKQSENQGNTKNVVVLTRPKGYRKEKNQMMPLLKMKYRKYPELLKAIENRHIGYNETLDYISQREKSGDVFVIRPEESLNLGRIEKDQVKLKAAYGAGYRQAAECYDKMMQYLR